MLCPQGEILKLVSTPHSIDRNPVLSNHLPQLIGSRQLQTGALKHERLLEKASMAEFEIHICKPVLDITRIAKNVLLVDGVIFRLYVVSYFPGGIYCDGGAHNKV
jgi:hypothetical protein